MRGKYVVLLLLCAKKRGARQAAEQAVAGIRGRKWAGGSSARAAPRAPQRKGARARGDTLASTAARRRANSRSAELSCRGAAWRCAASA